MDIAQQYSTNNSLIEGTFLDSQYFNPLYLFDQGYAFFQSIFPVIFNNQALSLFYTILFILAIFFLTLLSYCAIRMQEIRKKEHVHLRHEIAEYAHHKKEWEEKKNESIVTSENKRWVKTLTYLFGESSSDWKLAIIEADSMLEGLMSQLGFKGETLGDRLRAADQEKFRSLTIAWEVHTIRNRIAHEGLSYDISQREAKRVIALYESIFREFGYI